MGAYLGYYSTACTMVYVDLTSVDIIINHLIYLNLDGMVWDTVCPVCNTIHPCAFNFKRIDLIDCAPTQTIIVYNDSALFTARLAVRVRAAETATPLYLHGMDKVAYLPSNVLWTYKGGCQVLM